MPINETTNISSQDSTTLTQAITLYRLKTRIRYNGNRVPALLGLHFFLVKKDLFNSGELDTIPLSA